MNFFAGLRGTGSFGADERPKSFREFILWAEPNGRAPFTALSSKMKTESVNDPEFSWWQETLKPKVVYTTGTADASSGQITIGVDHGPGTHTDGYGNQVVDTSLTGLQFTAGDTLMADIEADPRLNELLQVVSATSSTLVLKRAIAGSTPVAITDNTRLRRVGSLFGEGTLSPATLSSNPTKFSNFCEIQKTSYGATNTVKATKVRTGDPVKNDRKRKMFDHAEKHEKAAIFGRPYETTDGEGNPVRSMGGILHYLTSHVTVFSATPTEATFIQAVAGMFDYNAGGAGTERVAFVGNGALLFLNQLFKASTQVRLNSDAIFKAYGMDLSKMVLPMGTVAFKSHPLFNIDPRLSYSMLFVNPAGIVRRPLTGRDTKDEKGIQPKDADYEKGQWIDEIGMEYHFEQTMGYLGNVRTI